jgi:hypothetical protein
MATQRRTPVRLCFGLLQLVVAIHRSARAASLKKDPGYFDTDFDVEKGFGIPKWESAHFSVGARFFNFFNHPNSAFSNTDIDSPQCTTYSKRQPTDHDVRVWFGSGRVTSGDRTAREVSLLINPLLVEAAPTVGALCCWFLSRLSIPRAWDMSNRISEGSDS